MNSKSTPEVGSVPYGTEPGFHANGPGPEFGPNNMGPGSDLPIGLSMLLMEDPVAMQHFAAISNEESMKILKYVESGVNGDDAQRRIAHTVRSLHDGTPGFYR